MVTLDSMRELRWVTALFYHISKYPSEIEGVLGKKQKKFTSFLLSLLSKFAGDEQYLHRLRATSAYEASKEVRAPCAQAGTCIRLQSGVWSPTSLPRHHGSTN